MLVVMLVMMVVRGTEEELGRGTAITTTTAAPVALRSAGSLLDWTFAQVNHSTVRDEGMRHGIKGQLGLRLVLELRQRGGSCGCEAKERERERKCIRFKDQAAELLSSPVCLESAGNLLNPAIAILCRSCISSPRAHVWALVLSLSCLSSSEGYLAL